MYLNHGATQVPRKRTVRAPAPADQPDTAEEWKGKHAIWTAVTREQKVRVLVRVVDAEDDLFGRVKCWIQIPSTGDKALVSHRSLKLVPEDKIRRRSPQPT
jgi:hypothetical protein